MNDDLGLDLGPGRTARRRPIGSATRLECRVCWTVYDPALGDEVWQIPPGTPFDQLPRHWSCPHCSAEQREFLVLEEPGDA